MLGSLKISHLKHIPFDLGSRKLSMVKEQWRIQQKKERLAKQYGRKNACDLVSISVG
jgi:hypothetical protein